MAPHWKFGNDFAIRYGSRGQINWFTKDELTNVASRYQHALHPAQLVLQGVETAATVALWWETRKQTGVMTAQFEERRLLWCADLMSTWATEVSSTGSLRLDTTRLLERELRRTMAVLTKTSKMEVPYSFVLQCQRVADALVPLNRLMYSELARTAGFGMKLTLPEYVPHDRLRALMPAVDSRAGVLESIRKALPFALGGADDPLTEWMRSTKKDPQLANIENLSLELRSSEELLQALEEVPDVTRDPAPEEEVADLAGVRLLASTMKVHLLPGAV